LFRKGISVNRDPDDNKSGSENQPRESATEGGTSAAAEAVAGVNLDDLGDLGPRVPVETGTSESNESQALAEAVRRALREGAINSWLDIQVEVADSVVRLHGRVEYYEDAEAAEAVASGVPGVRYVQDDLVIANMPSEG
jgi:osmotically-inducible protein OsmY